MWREPRDGRKGRRRPQGGAAVETRPGSRRLRGSGLGRGRSHRNRAAGEAGAVSIQAAIVVVPALFFVLVLALQATFAWMAALAVQTAAENAADAASARSGTEADAVAAADRVLSGAGYATVTSTDVAIGADTVRVEIRARAYQFLPLAWNVVGVAEASVEDFRSPQERE